MEEFLTSVNDANASNLKAFFTNVEELTDGLKTSETEATSNNTALININEKRWRLKHILKQLMSYHEFLNQLKKDPENWITQKDLPAKTQKIIDEYTKEKAEYNNLNENIMKLSDILDEAEKICELKSSVDVELEEIHKKKEQLAKLKKQYDIKFDIFKGKCNTETEATKLIDEQKQKIEEKLNLIEILETEKKVERNEMHDQSLMVLINLEKFFTTADQEDKPKDFSSQTLALAEELSGVSVKSQKTDCHSLQISYGNQENKSKVAVDLNFAKQKPPHPTKLVSIQVNDCSVSTDDITARAVSRNNFAEVIPEIQMRFEKSRSLSDEIEELRKTSAIDWIPSENKLLVIVGSRTCTLDVPDGYPHTGTIQLKNIQGIEDTQLTSMKPSKVEPLLTDWVGYLERELE